MTTSTAGRARAQQYRQSDKGRMARKLRRLNPEYRAKQAIRRAVKRHLKGR